MTIEVGDWVSHRDIPNEKFQVVCTDMDGMTLLHTNYVGDLHFMTEHITIVSKGRESLYEDMII